MSIGAVALPWKDAKANHESAGSKDGFREYSTLALAFCPSALLLMVTEGAMVSRRAPFVGHSSRGGAAPPGTVVAVGRG